MGDVRLDVRSAAEFREELERAREASVQLTGRKPAPALARRFHDDLMGAREGLLRAEVLEHLVREGGISVATLRRFQVGVVIANPDPVFGQDECTVKITVPHYRAGILVDIRYWGYPLDLGCKSVLSEPAADRIPLNADCLGELRKVPLDQRNVFVCSDEWSAIALLQLGYEFVVGCGDWLVSPDDMFWPPSWTELFIEAHRIYLCHDATPGGQEDAERVSKILGPHRCIRIVPPAVGSWYEAVSVGADCPDVDAAIAKGETMAPKEVTRPGDYLAGLEEKLFAPKNKGVDTGWPDLDRVLGGIRPGEVTVVTGGSGDGKSTWSTALSYHLACQGMPVLSIPLELTPVDILEMLVAVQGGKSSEHLTLPELRQAAEQVFALPYYMLDVRDKRGRRRTSMNVEEVIGYVRYAQETHGVRFVILDHLLRFFGKMDRRRQIDAIRPTMEKLSGFVQDTGIHLLIVCHPKTPSNDRRSRRAEYGVEDVWGGTATMQEAWNGISINQLDDITRIRVEKCRSQAGRKGYVDFSFDPEGLRYVSPGEAAADARAYENASQDRKTRAAEAEEDEMTVIPIRYYSDTMPTEEEWTEFNELVH
jgi:KaiC/GvpD/RAD55 family RecA-like ATPase